MGSWDRREGLEDGRPDYSDRGSSWQDNLPTACREIQKGQEEDNGQKSHLDGREEELGRGGLQSVQNLGTAQL